MTSNSRAVQSARILLVIFAVLLVYAVLLPSDGHSGLGLIRHVTEFIASFGLPHRPVFLATEFLANVAMFLPLGVLLPLAAGSQKRTTLLLTIAAGFALSLTIELAQLLIPGRVSDTRDLVSNTLGAALGVLLLCLAARIRNRRNEKKLTLAPT